MSIPADAIPENGLQVAEQIDEYLRSRGLATELMVHPNDPDGAIIGATGGWMHLSVTVTNTPLQAW